MCDDDLHNILRYAQKSTKDEQKSLLLNFRFCIAVLRLSIKVLKIQKSIEHKVILK